MISDKLGFSLIHWPSKICNAIHLSILKRDLKKIAQKKNTKNVIQKNVPKNLQNPEKNTKKIENTSRLKKNCQKNRKNNETEKIPHPQKKEPTKKHLQSISSL